MGRVLISGHWGGDRNPLPILDLLARGFQSLAPTWQMQCAPFGPGRAFVEAMRSHAGIAVLSTAEEADLKVLGARYRDAILAGKTPVLEGGHLAHTDGGVAFLEGLSGLSRALVFLRDRAITNIVQARRFLRCFFECEASLWSLVDACS